MPQQDFDIRPIDWSTLTQRYMNAGELEVLIGLVRSVRPRSVLEIGVNEGRTARAILQNVDSVKGYQGVDVVRSYVPSKDVQRREVPQRPGWMAFDDPRFQVIVRPRGSLDLAPADLEPCDVAFIDGDHGAEAVRHDSRLARELVRPGGMLIWHDYHDLDVVDVRDVLEEFADQGAPIFAVENTWLAFERV